MKNKRYSNFHGKYCTIDNQNYKKNLKSLRKNNLLLNTRVFINWNLTLVKTCGNTLIIRKLCLKG